jgi:hypothetical protein
VCVCVGAPQKEEAQRAALVAEQETAAALTSPAKKSVGSSVWGSSVAVPAKPLSLREIQEAEALKSAAAPAVAPAPVAAASPARAEGGGVLDAALKSAFGLPTGAPQPAPAAEEPSVWSGPAKVAKSLREIQEEEAAREAELQAKASARLPGKAAVAAASPWAKAAAKGASKMDPKPVGVPAPAPAIPKKSLREVQVGSP